METRSLPVSEALRVRADPPFEGYFQGPDSMKVGPSGHSHIVCVPGSNAEHVAVRFSMQASTHQIDLGSFSTTYRSHKMYM